MHQTECTKTENTTKMSINKYPCNRSSLLSHKLPTPRLAGLLMRTKPCFPLPFQLSPPIGQVVCAEAKFQHLWNHGDHPFKPVNGVGFQLSVSEIMPDHQLLIVQHGHNIGDPKGQPCLDGMKRSQALWHQKGWVAMDEMIFYLQTIHVSGTAVTTSPLDSEARNRKPKNLGRLDPHGR